MDGGNEPEIELQGEGAPAVPGGVVSVARAALRPAGHGEEP